MLERDVLSCLLNSFIDNFLGENFQNYLTVFTLEFLSRFLFNFSEYIVKKCNGKKSADSSSQFGNNSCTLGQSVIN